MALTVNLEDKKKKVEAPPPAELDDYVAPDERSAGIKAFLIWFFSLLILSGLLYGSGWLREIAIGVFAWWLLATIGYFFIGPVIVVRRLRQLGRETVINSRNHPRLSTLLDKGSGLLGIVRPEGFYLDEEISQIRILGKSHPYFLLVTSAASELLKPTELDALVLRSMVHARQNHVRRLTLLRFINDTPPAARILVWPVVWYDYLLRQMWLDLAEQTADRLTLLIVKNQNLLTSALIKQHAATDPLMQEHSIGSEDVDAYIKQSGAIGFGGDEILTQYKLGQAIHENPYLETRLKELRHFSESAEYKEAVQKLAEARASKVGKAGAKPATKSST